MYEKQYLRELYDWSLNGHNCWLDFLGIAHYDYSNEPIDFEIAKRLAENQECVVL